MSARLLILIGLIGAVPAAAGAGQSATADGVVALARGDYQRAVEILKPIADDLRTTDPVAQFFMAGLYETGRGVRTDAVRACALYARAASRHELPFSHVAEPLFLAYTRRSQEFDRECQLLAFVGFDHGFEPITFDLGPRHTIHWTAWDATVTHNGRTKVEEVSLAQPGARFLPLRHTELHTGPAGAAARHFIEVFLWYPTVPSGSSSLHWHLFEIAGDQVIPIETVNPLVTIEGNVPPARDSFDMREYAIVRLGDGGQPEWAVLKGPNQATQRIESEIERREVRETKAAREAALKRVDWDRRADVHRQPTMNYVDADGCGRSALHGWTADRAEALHLRVAAQELNLSTGSATYDLSRQSATISVEVHVFAEAQREFSFCSDVNIQRSPDSIEPEIWRAVAGTIAIDLSPPGIRARAPHLRRATVTLSKVLLSNGSGTTVSVARPVRLAAIVWSMGG